ncbi:MAG: hypothetical protein Q7U97_17635 [Rhodocyclaceae bacterium]|nr:hypothetical protein [Rhodocyclaceae bacterium]
MSAKWKDRLATAALLLFLLLVHGVVGRWDFDDARRGEEAARQVRELVSAAGWCGPKPGQVALQEWRGDRLHCTIKENTGYGRAPRIVARLEAPMLMHPLATTED